MADKGAACPPACSKLRATSRWQLAAWAAATASAAGAAVLVVAGRLPGSDSPPAFLGPSNAQEAVIGQDPDPEEGAKVAEAGEGEMVPEGAKVAEAGEGQLVPEGLDGSGWDSDATEERIEGTSTTPSPFECTNLHPPPADTRRRPLLIFWAVNSQQRTIELVTRNIEHAQASGVADIAMVHYDLRREEWLRQLTQERYRDAVRWSFNCIGWKLHLLRKIVLTTAGITGSYAWVWALDEDMDITPLDIRRLLLEATVTKSLLVTPSFMQAKVCEKADSCVDKLEAPWYPINKPLKRCTFRYVSFIEIIQPLIRSDALEHLCKCEDCLMPDGADWGIDNIWCHLLARALRTSPRSSCAILDEVSDVHRNYKSTKNVSGMKSQGKAAIKYVKAAHKEDFRDPKEYSCVVRNAPRTRQ